METVFFVVLVPHRDCLPALNDYRRRLFAIGFEGAWSFPAVAPLARLSRPLDSGELKTAASELRSLLGNRMIFPVMEDECTGGVCTDGWGPYRFFGATLDLPSPVLPADAVLQCWEKPVLAPAILASDFLVSGYCRLPILQQNFMEDHKILFRAAALANLALMPVLPENPAEFTSFEADYSFNWKLGPLCWLPRRKKGDG